MPKLFKNHKRIIFNGNGYDDSWIQEAEKRGLLNLRTTPDALPYFVHEKNIELFERNKVLNREEIYSRYEIMMEEYTKTINIEALTMINMAQKEILPAALKYSKHLAQSVKLKRDISTLIDTEYEEVNLTRLSSLLTQAYKNVLKLQESVDTLKGIDDFEKAAFFVRDTLILDMEQLRKPCDEMESIVSSQDWPFPTYGKLLFGII